MKKKLLYIVLVWLAGMGAAFGQVTGKATLFGETDHSGIKVKFIAQSPSAKTDSVLTNSDGSYSANLLSGIYTIQFIKSAFEIVENPYTTSLLVKSITDLSPVVLVKSSNILSGSIEGVLKRGWYVVQNEIDVDISKKLVIEPGTKLFFAKDAKFLVAGELSAIGTKNDSIYFTSYNSNLNSKWNGFTFYDNHNVRFQYSSLSNANNLFHQNAQYGLLTVNESFLNNNRQLYGDISDFTTYVYFDISNCFIQNSRYVFSFSQERKNAYNIKCNSIFWKDFRYDNIDAGEVSVFKISSNGFIENNIVDGQGLESNVLISNRLSYLSDTNIYHKTYFQKNLIINFDRFEFELGLTRGGNKSQSNDMLFINNTLVGGNAKISSTNTMTFQNFPGIKQTLIKNNLFDCNTNICNQNYWNLNVLNNIMNKSLTTHCTNSYGDYDLGPIALGQKITTNVNGDSVDTYLNLFQDPKFLNGTAPYLAANSPAIGAGIDDKGNAVNIGFDPTGTCLESYFPKPNPVISADTLSIAGLVHQGSGLLSDGVVMAVEKASGKARYQKVSNGVFKLDSLRKSEYVLYAVPNPLAVTGYLPTYYVNKVKLSEATPLNLLGKIKDVDIYLAAKPSVVAGNYTIQGRFSYADNNTDDTTVFAKTWFATSYAPASPIVITENPCKNLPVVLYNDNNQLVQSTVTDLDGYFVFQNLTSGTYKAQGQRVNYSTEHDGVVQVGNNTTETANLRLEQVVAGLEDESVGNANAVMAYPNPFKDELQLKGYKGAVSILDLTGTVYFETTISNNETIDASNWPSGFYLLETGNKVQKIVKQD